MIITVGTFDLFHLGHMRFLTKAWFYDGGDMLVGVNTDKACAKFGKAPVMDEKLRLATVKVFLTNLLVADKPLIYPNHEPRLTPFLTAHLRKYKDEDHILIIGNDWKPAAYEAQIGLTRKELKEKFNCDLVFLPYTKGISSTDIKEAIKHDRRLTAHKK